MNALVGTTIARRLCRNRRFFLRVLALAADVEGWHERTVMVWVWGLTHPWGFLLWPC